MPQKQTSWFDDMLMAVSRRSNDIVGAAADLADRYGITPANAAAWIARNVERRSPQEVERIRRNLQPLGSNRAIVNAGALANEARFRQAGGRGARAEEEVMAPVRLGAAAYKPAEVPKAVVREAPGALRAVGRYVETSTPQSVAADVGQLARSGYDAFKADPYGSIFNTGLYAAFPGLASVGDYAAMREGSEMLDPYVGEDEEAARAKRMVDAASVLPLAVAAPLIGVNARKIRRKRGGLAVKKKGC